MDTLAEAMLALVILYSPLTVPVYPLPAIFPNKAHFPKISLKSSKRIVLMLNLTVLLPIASSPSPVTSIVSDPLFRLFM
jgi:hypothetical protein